MIFTNHLISKSKLRCELQVINKCDVKTFCLSLSVFFSFQYFYFNVIIPRVFFVCFFVNLFISSDDEVWQNIWHLPRLITFTFQPNIFCDANDEKRSLNKQYSLLSDLYTFGIISLEHHYTATLYSFLTRLKL